MAQAQVSVTTYHNDNARDGQNLNETVLTLVNVNTQEFGLLFVQPVDGQVYAQPLYVPNLQIAGGAHNVVFVATEHDSVYAFDADGNTGANANPLWHVSFIDPAAGITTLSSQNDVGCTNISPEIGITGTPVLDLTSGTLYVVVNTKENGVFFQRLHALDITSGAENYGGPIVIQATVPGTGAGNAGGQVAFDPLKNNQRPGLLLLNGLVYLSWASHCDVTPFHGWVMAYNAQSLQQVAVWNSSPNGSDGGVWESGAGPAADSSGNVYLASGNGTFDLNAEGSDAGDSILKFGAPSGGNLPILDYFTPYNQLMLSTYDTDLGSGGVLLLPDQPAGSPHQHLLVEMGKEGSLYLVNRDSMGHFNGSGDTQIVQWLPGILGGLWATPAFWNDTLYLGGTHDALQAFSFNAHSGVLSTSPVSSSPETYGFPGPTPSISANGNTNGILWALEEDSGSTILHAYDATNLANELFSTANNRQQTPGPPVKFAVPTIANGKVYAGTATQLAVYGLLGPPPSPPALVSPPNGATAVSLTPALKWNAAGGAISYDVYFGTSPSPPMVTNTGATSYNPPPLRTNTVYYWTIAARNLGGTASSAMWSFTTTATAGPPVSVTATAGSGQIAAIGAAFATALQATVTDAAGNLVGGFPVTFTLPTAGASGAFAGSSTVATNTQGVATAPVLTANSVVGSYLATAAAGSLRAIFSLTNMPTALVPGEAQIAAPVPGIALSGSLATFSWAAVAGASQYQLNAGTSLGATNIFSGTTTKTSQTVGYIPCAGGSVYVQLRTYINGGWLNPADYSYPCKSAIGDFNGDGSQDLLFQNTSTGQVNVNYFGGAGPQPQGYALLNNGSTLAGWKVVGAADFDRNGVPDLVLQNSTSGQVNVNYYGGAGGTAVIGSAVLNSGAGTAGWAVVAVADQNGDGVPDLIWQSSGTGQVNVDYYGGAGGASLTGYAVLNSGAGTAGWRVLAAADFDGNGTPDLVWQNPSSGQVNVNYYGGSGGATFIGWAELNTGAGTAGWSVVAAADWNADGVPDLIWQNNSTLQVNVNYYGGGGGAKFEGWNCLDCGSNFAGWSVRAVAAFGASGEQSLVWQNANTNAVNVYYYGLGGYLFQGWNLMSKGTAGWRVVATADFDGNGVPDLVWQNTSTGQVNVDYYGGTGGAALIGYAVLNGGAGTAGWSVVAAADMNGDGAPDLIWQNAATGQVNVNYYAGAGGATFTGYAVLNNGSGTAGWHVVGAADFDGNGVPDLIWQNTSTRQVNVNYYGGATGTTLIGYAVLNSGTAGWTVVGANDYDGNGVPDLVWRYDSSGVVNVNYYGGPGGAVFKGWNVLSSTPNPGWSVIVPRSR